MKIISDKGIASRIWKELLQLNNKKTNTELKNEQRIRIDILQRFTKGQQSHKRMLNIFGH